MLPEPMQLILVTW